jgi:hypothetical protein
MLTQPRATTARRVAVGLALALVAALVVLAGPSGVAHAAASGKKCTQYKAVTDPLTGQITYVCVQWGDPSPGGGGPVKPSCDLLSPATFCNGTEACWYSPWHPPWALPIGPPAPKEQPMILNCYEDGATAPTSYPVWVGPNVVATPPLAAQAVTAIGQLNIPVPHLAFNPPGRTLVGIPTYFWAENAPGGELTGSSAFGLVAIATPDHLVVDPGDGSGAQNCPWVTSESAASQDCTYTYLRSSVNGSASHDGQPAYAATVTASYTIRFEDGGTPVNIPGVQTTITSAAATSAVPVAEVQAIVTGSR